MISESVIREIHQTPEMSMSFDQVETFRKIICNSECRTQYLEWLLRNDVVFRAAYCTALREPIEEHGAYEAIAIMLLRLVRDTSAWRERPTCPGVWICYADDRRLVVLNLTQDDLDRGSPFRTRCVYGPVSEPRHV